MKKLKQEHSSGGIVFKMIDSGIVFLLGKHSGYHKWVLPKGLIEPGEDPKNTALREVKEETGIVAKIVENNPIMKLEYFYEADLKVKGTDNSTRKSIRRVEKYQENGGKKVQVHKVVEFYLMEYISGNPKDHDWEMEDAGWFLYHEAIEKLSFDTEKKALITAQDILTQMKV